MIESTIAGGVVGDEKVVLQAPVQDLTEGTTCNQNKLVLFPALFYLGLAEQIAIDKLAIEDLDIAARYLPSGFSLFVFSGVEVQPQDNHSLWLPEQGVVVTLGWRLVPMQLGSRLYEKTSNAVLPKGKIADARRLLCEVMGKAGFSESKEAWWLFSRQQ